MNIDSPRIGSPVIEAYPGTSTVGPGTPVLSAHHNLPYLHSPNTGSAFNVNAPSSSSTTFHGNGHNSPTQRPISRKSSKPFHPHATSSPANSRKPSGSAQTSAAASGSGSGMKDSTKDSLPPGTPQTPQMSVNGAVNGTSSPNPGTQTTSAPPGRMRTTPHLPHMKDVPDAPPTLMHWSRAPVHGMLPMRNARAHTVTLVDNVAWLFGGCDEKGCWQDVYTFDTETMQWSHPEMLGDVPPPCRAHTATLVDRRIFVFAGGEGPTYYNELYILDTTTHRWVHVEFGEGEKVPASRRAHTAVLYKNRLWVFGGGNGMRALNDLWTLDVNVPVEKMRWQEVDTRGGKPTARGYHTSNLIGNVMIVVGGSDGRECFSDIWILNLDTRTWSEVNPEKSYRRLAHTSTQVGSYLYIFGGHDGSKYTSELLLFNLVSLQYEPRLVMGRPPSPRGYHVTQLSDSRLFVFGGFNGHDVYDDVFVLDLAGAAYLPQVTSFQIAVD